MACFNGMIADDVDGKRVFAFTCRLRPEVLLGGQWFRHFEANCTALEGWFMVVPRHVVTTYWETIFFIDDSKRQALIILFWRVSWWKEWWFEHVQLQRLDMCPKSIWNRCNLVRAYFAKTHALGGLRSVKIHRQTICIYIIEAGKKQ